MPDDKASPPNPGEPAPGEPAPGEPAPGEPAPGEPAPGEPAPGEPSSGEPAPGEPSSGEPAPGEPAPGEPAPGEPASSEPASGSPIDERVLLRGNRFDVCAMDLRGRDGEIVTREVIRHAGAVVILPILDADTIVMIRNTRPTVGETLLELPAGTREPGESAVETARRELIEETGYRGETFTPLHEFYSAPGICDERMTLFVAENLTAGDANLESTEQITNRLVSAEEVAGLIERGEIRDAKTLVGLYAFLARRKR